MLLSLRSAGQLERVKGSQDYYHCAPCISVILCRLMSSIAAKCDCRWADIIVVGVVPLTKFRLASYGSDKLTHLAPVGVIRV